MFVFGYYLVCWVISYFGKSKFEENWGFWGIDNGWGKYTQIECKICV